MSYEHREPTEKDYATARTLIDEGWHSISRRYRMIARLPDDMTGQQALRWAIEQYNEKPVSAHEEAWIDGLGDAQAARHFMRVYTCYEFSKAFSRVLRVFEYQAFRKLGGRTA